MVRGRSRAEQTSPPPSGSSSPCTPSPRMKWLLPTCSFLLLVLPLQGAAAGSRGPDPARSSPQPAGVRLVLPAPLLWGEFVRLELISVCVCRAEPQPLGPGHSLGKLWGCDAPSGLQRTGRRSGVCPGEGRSWMGSSGLRAGVRDAGMFPELSCCLQSSANPLPAAPRPQLPLPL